MFGIFKFLAKIIFVKLDKLYLLPKDFINNKTILSLFLSFCFITFFKYIHCSQKKHFSLDILKAVIRRLKFLSFQHIYICLVNNILNFFFY